MCRTGCQRQVDQFFQYLNFFPKNGICPLLFIKIEPAAGRLIFLLK